MTRTKTTKRYERTCPACGETFLSRVRSTRTEVYCGARECTDAYNAAVAAYAAAEHKPQPRQRGQAIAYGDYGQMVAFLGARKTNRKGA